MITNPNDGNTPRVEIALPEITVSSAGLITATSEQAAGYVPGGTKSSTKQLTTQGAKTVTPGTAAQTAVASGRYTTGAVTVKGDANLKAENIAEGVSIFGVTGTHSGGTKAVCTVTSIGWDYMNNAYISTGSEIIDLKNYKGQSIEIVVPTVLTIYGNNASWEVYGNYSELNNIIYGAYGNYAASFSITGDISVGAR